MSIYNFIIITVIVDVVNVVVGVGVGVGVGVKFNNKPRIVLVLAKSSTY